MNKPSARLVEALLNLLGLREPAKERLYHHTKQAEGCSNDLDDMS
jgi:hypothetical protein